MRVHSSAFSGKESQHSRHNSRGGWSHIETREKPSWILPQSQRHRFRHPLEIRPDALPQIECTPEYQVTTGRATDTPVASSRKKKKKHAGSKFNSTRGLTPHSQLKRKAEFNASTQDEACLPCLNSTETVRSVSEMERKPEVPASTRDEALFIPTAM